MSPSPIKIQLFQKKTLTKAAYRINSKTDTYNYNMLLQSYRVLLKAHLSSAVFKPLKKHTKHWSQADLPGVGSSEAGGTTTEKALSLGPPL